MNAIAQAIRDAALYEPDPGAALHAVECHILNFGLLSIREPLLGEVTDQTVQRTFLLIAAEALT